MTLAKQSSKRFICDFPLCNKSFSRKDHLKRHQLNHDSSTPQHVCEVCGMKFKRADVKREHVNRHLRGKRNLPQSQNHSDVDSATKDFVNGEPDISTIEWEDWLIDINDNIFGPLRNPQDDYNLRTGNGNDFSDYLNRPDLNFEHSLNSTLLELLESDLGSIPTVVTNPTLITQDIMNKFLICIPSLGSVTDFTVGTLEICMNVYWDVFHIQYPIIHKPSFDTSQAPALLLLSMVMIGACFTKASNFPINDSVLLSNTIGNSLRWLIFQHRSPGASEPWELQSLLILEVFEKHYSTRALHERSGVHQATKIEMMKRSTLLGGDPYATESKSLTELSDNDGVLLLNKWIRAESMKRCALMAFCFDLNSNITSGHQSTLYVNKLRLGLPCDDELWETDLANISKIDIPGNPKMVLSELKRLLKGEKLQTSSFGKKVILHSIVSLMIQLETKDEITSMISEYSHNDILKDAWRDKLSYALDLWKFNVNESICCDVNSLLVDLRFRKTISDTIYFDLNDTKCKYPSYHMAQIRLRVVNHDMLIFAGVSSRMSVQVDKKDYENVKFRLGLWADSLDGRVSVVHAFMCLFECLMNHQLHIVDYSPERDPIHERPHIINDSLLIVWCFVFLKYGPESDIYVANYKEIFKESAYDYLSRVSTELFEELGNVKTASEYHVGIKRCASKLAKLKNLNHLASLTDEVSTIYSKCFWELGREYSRLLVHCKERSLGKKELFCLNMYE